MRKILKVLAFLLRILFVMFSITGAVSAQSYSGFGIGSNSTESESSLGVKIYGGYQFNEHFAVEFTPVAYSSFMTTTTVNNDVPQGTQRTTYEATRQVSAISLTALGLLPVNEQFKLFVKGGLAHWKADSFTKTTITSTLPEYPDSVFISSSTGPTASNSGFSPVLGVGAQYTSKDDVFFRVEYEKYTNIGNGMDMIGVSAGVMF